MRTGGSRNSGTACLSQAILNATVRQKRKFRRALEHHENLALVEVCHWAGLGGVRYIPGPWLGQPLDEAGREDINRLNSELVLKLKSTDSAFSLGEPKPSHSFAVAVALVLLFRGSLQIFTGSFSMSLSFYR